MYYSSGEEHVLVVICGGADLSVCQKVVSGNRRLGLRQDRM